MTIPSPVQMKKTTLSHPPIPVAALVIALIEALVLDVSMFSFLSLGKHTNVKLKYDPKKTQRSDPKE